MPDSLSEDGFLLGKRHLIHDRDPLYKTDGFHGMLPWLMGTRRREARFSINEEIATFCRISIKRPADPADSRDALTARHRKKTVERLRFIGSKVISLGNCRVTIG